MWTVDIVLTVVNKLGTVAAMDFDEFIQGEFVKCEHQTVMKSW